MNIRTQLLLVPLILAFILNGCATAPPSGMAPPADSELLQRAQKAINKGNLETAAREYLRLADQSSTLKRPEYQLQAATLLLQGNYVEQAERVLRQIEPSNLHDLQLIRRQLLAARIALINHRTGDALQALEIPIPPTLNDTQRAELYQLRAEAYSRRDNPVKAARNYVLASTFMTDSDALLTIQHRIWQLLSQLTDQDLVNLRSAPAPDAFSGWLELVRIARDSQSQPTDVATRITNWRQQYPAHSVNQAILDALLARQGKVAQHPQQIALLLPFAGPYQKPAAVIRDGFLTAYYQQQATGNKTQQGQTEIKIYDTSRFDSITAAYDQAVADGAEFVIGPLAKDDVTKLAQSRQLPVPVLTLNYADEGDSAEGLYQFGLAPEQEAQQVAERAWLDGHNQALMITPDSEWGERVAQAFASHWEKLGGTLMKQQTYPGDKNDFSVQIQALLELDNSKARNHQLKSLLKQDLRFEPRRRQDTDFIFMAAFPRQARLLRPQLRFHYASSLPVYATSHVFTGKRNRYKDRDMDGIMFCDTPWTMNKTFGPLKRRLNKQWPEQMSDYTRFYALGIDAYQLIPQLDYLRMFKHERFNGYTGVLHLNNERHIFRTLSWAQFKKGLPGTLQ